MRRRLERDRRPAETSVRFDSEPDRVRQRYAAHEQKTFEQVVSRRNLALAAPTASDKIAAENALSASLKSLLALSENYPDLKANQNFLHKNVGGYFVSNIAFTVVGAVVFALLTALLCYRETSFPFCRFWRFTVPLLRRVFLCFEE